MRAEGYATSKTFAGADLVIVNTCGFIDDAVKESLDTIGEALAENGKVIVTGCLGAKAGEGGGNLVRQMHPSVLAVTGPHATEEVMDAVHAHVPKPHDPFVDLVPAPASIGIKLTPKHYAYLKISEGCNHRCTFCIIPSMRGDLVSRPIGDVLGEAKALFESGVRELLVISQDTSAYGVDVKLPHRLLGRPAGQDAACSTCASGSPRSPSRTAPGCGCTTSIRIRTSTTILPLMASGRVLPYLDVPFQHSHPDVLQAHEAAGERREEPRAAAALARDLSRARRAQHLHRRLSRRDRGRVRAPARLHARGADRPRRLLRLFAGGRAPPPTSSPGMLPAELREERRARFMAVAEAVSIAKLRARVGATMQVLVDSAPALGRKGGVGRSYADAPEIDGRVRLLPPEKASKTFKAGEFTRARIVAVDGHDLVGASRSERPLPTSCHAEEPKPPQQHRR